MASVERVETFKVPVDKIYQVLVDFSSYHEFVDGVDKIEVLKQTKRTIKAKYFLNLIKKFEYTINVKLKEKKEVSWSLDSGDLFKKNDGSWSLKVIDDETTEVTYKAELEAKVFVPKMVMNKLVKTSLPLMMSSFHKRAKSL